MRRLLAREVVLELTIALGLALVALLVLLRGRWLLAGTTPLRLAILVLVLGTLALRARRSSRQGERAAGLAPGRWLEGVGPPELVLAAATMLVLALLPGPSSPLGADSAPQLEQLGDVFLRGHLASHPGLEPGASLLWAPFFALGHVVAVTARAFGADVAVDGYAEPYRNALRLGAVFFGLLAAILAYRACRRHFAPLLAAVCVSGVWLSSSLLHYTVAEPAMPHAPAAAMAALLLLLWLRAREAPDRLARWVAVSFVGGLLVSIQRYDVYLLLGPMLSGAGALRAARRGDARPPLPLLAAVVLAFTLGVLPLVLLTFSTPDRFLLSPEVARTTMLSGWSHPRVGELLFSSNGGLFAWTPVALLAVIGLGLLIRRDRALGLSLLATLALGVCLLASNPQWWGGWSFGARRMTEAFALLSLGFCAFSERALRHPRVLGLGALALLVGNNVLLSRAVSRGALPPDDAVSFTEAAQAVAEDFHAAVGHPPSWPANWLFAWRRGVNPDRFDELYGRIPRPRWLVRAGLPVEKAVLGRGWQAEATADPPAGLRWALGRDATLLFTLTSPVARRLGLRAVAPPHPQGLDQGLVVEVNGKAVGRVLLGTRPREWSVVVGKADWKPDLNEVRLRAEWSLSRAEAYDLGVPAFAAWAYVEVSLEPVEP